jgi:hypothetical protein
MQCPKCKSNRIVKNGRRKDKQNYLCRNYDRQFIDTYDLRGYSHQDNKVWLWTVVNSHQAGVLKWVIGDRSQETFRHLWWIIRGWSCFLSQYRTKVAKRDRKRVS